MIHSSSRQGRNLYSSRAALTHEPIYGRQNVATELRINWDLESHKHFAATRVSEARPLGRASHPKLIHLEPSTHDPFFVPPGTKSL